MLLWEDGGVGAWVSGRRGGVRQELRQLVAVRPGVRGGFAARWRVGVGLVHGFGVAGRSGGFGGEVGRLGFGCCC